MAQYNLEMCRRLKIHCENGKSLESFPAHIGVSPKVIEDWFHQYPEFKEAVETAPCWELYYWEMNLIHALKNLDKDSINISKVKIEKLSKVVSSPTRKNTYSNLRENKTSNQISASSGDLIKDLSLLLNSDPDRKSLKSRRN